MAKREEEQAPTAREEVTFHLEMQIRALTEAGWSEEAARREAARRFGNVEGIERALLRVDRRRERRQRWMRGLRDLRRDVAYALRSLRKRPLFALVSVLTLSLGLGATSAVFALVDGTLLRPLPLPEEDRLVYVRETMRGEVGYPASLPEFEDWTDQASFVEAATALTTNAYTWTGEGAPELVSAGLLAGDPARTFRLRPLAGRAFTTEELATGAHVVMLSETIWRERYGGRSDVLGRSLMLSDEAYTVIGVMPRALGTLRVRNVPQLWMPLPRLPMMTRGLHFLDVLARLAPGVSLEQARAQAAALSESLVQDPETDHGLWVTSLREELTGSAREPLLILLGAVLVVLCIVCANVANLVLARSLERTREFGVRMAMGAGTSRLARQVVTESMVLGLLGGLGSLGVAVLVARLIGGVSSTASFLSPPALDARVLGFTLLASMGVALAFGLWPALRVARADVAETLRSTSEARSLGGGLGALKRRRMIAGAELALCVVLLAGAGLLVRTMVNLLRQDTGFVADRVLTATMFLPPARYDSTRRAVFLEGLVLRLQRLPGVEHVAYSSHLPLDRGDTNGGFEIIGRAFAPGELPTAKKRIVSEDYFAALGIPVLSGRVFSSADREGAPEVAIVSEAVARRWWPGENPVGRRIRFLWGSELEQEVVGVVGDVKHDGLDEPMAGMIFVPTAQFAQPGFSVLLKTSRDPLQLVPSLRSEVLALDATLALSSVRPMTQIVTGSVAPRRTTMIVFAAFAALALLLATVGVYAIAAQAVTQRTHEIGLRMAIGAARGDVLRLVLGQELPVIAASATVGLLAALAATRVLRASLFQVAPSDPLTLGLAVVLLVVVALMATWLPARRAARLDPLRALRSE